MQVKWLRTALRNLDAQISFISEDFAGAAHRPAMASGAAKIKTQMEERG
jgi:hypothetical protein